MGTYWFAPDPYDNIPAPSHDGPDAEAVGKLDAIAEWTLGYGADFDVTQSEPVGTRFDRLIAVAPKTDPSAGTPAWNRFTKLLPPFKDDPPAAARDRRRRALDENARFVYPAPIPENAVPERGDIADDPAWTRPASAEPARVVVMAVIDDAINLAHERFRARGGATTRIDFAWVQDADHRGAVPFGRELTGPDIDAALATHGEDDTAVLGALGLLDFHDGGLRHLGGRQGHGTHVLDVAAGDAPAHAQDELRIIAVQLPRLVTRDTSGQHYTAFVFAALEYILQRASAIHAGLGDVDGRKLPVIVNFSYGISGGPHDGTNFIEDAIETLTTAPAVANKLDIYPILPMGNRNLDRGHASATAAEDGPTGLTLPWRLPPGDTSSSYLEIYVPADAAFGVAVTLPDGTVRDLGDLSHPQVLMSPRNGARVEEAIVARIARDEPLRWTGEAAAYRRVLLALAPTDPLPDDRSPAPHGLWRVSVTATLSAGERINAWLLRDDFALGHRPLGAQQSYLDDPLYLRTGPDGKTLGQDPPDSRSVVRRSGACNGMAMSPSTVRVGAYQVGGRAAKIVDYSGTAADWMGQPLAAAATDRSPRRPGILVAGLHSGTTVPLNGTSVAAPQIARCLARAMMDPPSAPPADAPPIPPDLPPKLRAVLQRIGHQLRPEFLAQAAQGGGRALPPPPSVARSIVYDWDLHCGNNAPPFVGV